MSETMPTTSQGPEAAERRGMPTQAPGNDTLERRVAELERLFSEIGSLVRLPDAHPNIYPANQSQNGFWQELVVNAGNLINLGTGSGTIGVDILGCNETVSGSTLLHLADGQGLVVELEDLTGMRPVWIPNAATAVYLTATGSNYDVFADAGKTIKLASNVTPETASGLFQWNGSNSRLILPTSGISPPAFTGALPWSDTTSGTGVTWLLSDGGQGTLGTGASASISSRAIALGGAHRIVVTPFKGAGSAPAGTLYVDSINGTAKTAIIKSTSGSDVGLSFFWLTIFTK